jgi:hypothetical protein
MTKAALSFSESLDRIRHAALVITASQSLFLKTNVFSMTWRGVGQWLKSFTRRILEGVIIGLIIHRIIG